MTVRRVLSVGQCFADHGSIFRFLHTRFGAQVVPASSAEEALDQARREAFDLVLVNRILDADGTAGIEIVKRLKADAATKDVPVMLVSNYEEAQQEAVAAGAEPGFGKAALGQPRTVGRLRRILAPPA